MEIPLEWITYRYNRLKNGDHFLETISFLNRNSGVTKVGRILRPRGQQTPMGSEVNKLREIFYFLLLSKF